MTEVSEGRVILQKRLVTYLILQFLPLNQDLSFDFDGIEDDKIRGVPSQNAEFVDENIWTTRIINYHLFKFCLSLLFV